MIPLLVDDSNSFISNWAAYLIVWGIVLRLIGGLIMWLFGGHFPWRRQGYGDFK